jgi:hypothetical protein
VAQIIALKKKAGTFNVPAFCSWLSAISYQLSAISFRLSVLSAVSVVSRKH